MRKSFSHLATRVKKRSDPDDLHDLRVLTRRMRAVVWLSRHATSGPRLKKLRGVLSELGHALGERRTQDVLERDAAHYGLEIKARPRSKAIKVLKSKNLETVEQMMVDAESELQRLQTKGLRPAVAELIVRLELLQRSLPKSDQEWHRLRIEVKKIRYASELLGLDTSEIKKLQDLLGKGHDLGVLMDESGHQPRIAADIRKCWTRAKKLVPLALGRTRTRLLNWRDTESAH
ncbi:MAG: CHAD domain-containing protein [Bdellovibrionia bacterium]